MLAVVLVLGSGVLILGVHLIGTRRGEAAASATPAIPAFDFKLVKVAPVSASSTNPSKLMGPARTAAASARGVLDQLYREGFLDSSNWTAGSYDNLWPLFEGGAAAAARSHIDVITVGSAASGYKTVEPANGNLTVRVLLDAKNQPATMVATTRFTAIATRSDGMTTALVSDGQYVLRPVGGGWKIASFHVTRADHSVTPGPSPSTSASVVAS